VAGDPDGAFALGGRMMAGLTAAARGAPPAERIVDNASWGGATPRLSVLVPFFRYDPRPLLEAMSGQTEPDMAVEFVLLDDGGGDEALVERVAQAVADQTAAARLIVLSRNAGRAQGRNRLAASSRGRHLLFLDCDMRPASDTFLRRHLACALNDDPLVVGGFCVEARVRRKADALHAALQRRSECLPAARRSRHPEKYVYTSNLLVRRDVFEAEPFDAAFTGWGWEDVEWGVRVARRHPIRHLDNPATHLGMDAPEVLARKYEQSAANFAHLAATHPETVRQYPSFRAATAFKRVPFLKVWRRAFKGVALTAFAPLVARVAAMKAYRAALYADALP